MRRIINIPLWTSMAALALAITLGGCSSGSNNSSREAPEAMDTPAVEDPAPMNIVETAMAAGNFETLIAAAQAAGLDEVLADETQTFTVFAPTDDAFAVLGDEVINGLLADTDKLSDILLYHVLSGQSVDAATAVSLAGSTVETANGDSIAVTLSGDDLFINFAQVITADINTSNGIIHVIDAVLMPPMDSTPTGSIVDVAVASEDFTTLVAALQATGLDAVLADGSSTFTVFAPTNAAFELLGEDTINALLADTDALSDILLYHVFSGGAVDAVTALSLTGTEITMANGDSAAIARDGMQLTIAGANIVVTDIAATNGVIHVIDAVILPPSEELGSIVDVAVAAGDFTTLVAALQSTGLDATLADLSSTFTVFAPTDTAFNALGQETIDSLLADPDTLSNILLYHVIAGQAVPAETALSLAGSMVEMANGDSSTLTVSEDKLFIDDAEVIITDIEAANGIIHVIDAVILPPGS
jgi:transforming growth factor-beta-induced protein